MLYITYILVVLNLFFSSKAEAYPNFISYSYQSCITCHYNPFGNGPLTDYGRAIGATEIADTKLAKNIITEEDISEISSFLYGQFENDTFKPHANYRGLYLVNNLGEESSEGQWINMMANVGVVLRPTQKDSFFFVATIGYKPNPISGSSADETNVISREHYFGYRLSKEHGVYAGKMDKVFGIRVPDHNSYSRIATNLTMDDGAHGLLYHYTIPEIDFGLNAFIGDVLEDEDGESSKGLSAKIEYSINNKNRVGGSFLTQSSDFLKSTMYAIHLRSGLDQGTSVLAEFGRIKKETVSGVSTESEYLFMQNQNKITHGFSTILSFEYLKQNLEEEVELIKIGPGIQYFPIHGVELRSDIYNQKLLSKLSYADDSWIFTGQIHLWL